MKDNFIKNPLFISKFIHKIIVGIATLVLLSPTNAVLANTTGLKTPDRNVYGAGSNTIIISDEILNAKISLPSTKSFYKADREINRNMANEIRQLNHFRYPMPVYNASDVNINDAFFMEFKIQPIQLNDIDADKEISNIFFATNLDYNLSNSMYISDNEINKSFESSYFISYFANTAIADINISYQFYTENK